MPPDELNNAPDPQEKSGSRWLWIVLIGLFAGYAFGSYIVPVVYQPSDAEFISIIADVLDQNYHSPSSLNYSKLYNAALQGVAEQLKKEGVAVKPFKMNLKWSRKEADRQFAVEWEKIQKAAANLPKKEKEFLLFLAADYFLRAVDDSHTHFMFPLEYDLLNKELSGEASSFVGIGIAIKTFGKGFVYVDSLSPGGPAEKSGLKKFDQITAVNGKSAADWDIVQVAKNIKGEASTAITLTVKRKGKILNIKVLRGYIQMPVFTADRKKVENKRVDYLRLRAFTSLAAPEINKYFNTVFAKQKPDGIILDLRGNLGGELQMVLTFLDCFLNPDTPLFILQREEGGFFYFAQKVPASQQVRCPLVVLIDGGSASASELLSGVLQENNRATIVGKKSMGVVSAGAYIKLPRGAGMMVAMEQIFTAKGKKLEKVGVQPDYALPLTKEDVIRGEDVQLNKALEMLKDRMR